MVDPLDPFPGRPLGPLGPLRDKMESPFGDPIVLNQLHQFFQKRIHALDKYDFKHLETLFRGFLMKVKISDNFVNRKKNPITDEKRYLRGFHDKVLFWNFDFCKKKFVSYPSLDLINFTVWFNNDIFLVYFIKKNIWDSFFELCLCSHPTANWKPKVSDSDLTKGVMSGVWE